MLWVTFAWSNQKISISYSWKYYQYFDIHSISFFWRLGCQGFLILLSLYLFVFQSIRIILMFSKAFPAFSLYLWFLPYLCCCEGYLFRYCLLFTQISIFRLYFGNFYLYFQEYRFLFYIYQALYLLGSFFDELVGRVLEF